MTDATEDLPVDLERMLGLDVAEACRPGVLANLDLLAHHARIVDAFLNAKADT